MRRGLLISFSLILLFIWLLPSCESEVLRADQKILEDQVIAFHLATEIDTIEFVIQGKELNDKKPIFLWCQGSLPTPLFCEIEGQGNYFFGGGVSNFDYKKIAKDYHLVIISMPYTPLIGKKENLNSRFQYIPNMDEPNSFDEDYVNADYLDNYVRRGLKVLRYLKEQEYVDPSKLIVAGGSQGTKIATKLALANQDITNIGLFSPNPFGRLDQRIRSLRLEAQLGNISWETADSLMNDRYEFAKEVSNPDSIKAYPYLKAWESFSEILYDDWLSLDIPIYLAYGTEDRTSDLCDIVPLFFIQNEKDNLTLNRCLGLDHNFFPKGEDGRPDYNNGQWSKVVDDFLDSIE